MHAPGIFSIVILAPVVILAICALLFWLDVWKAVRIYNRINDPDRR